jgi:hypothetical protein
VIPIVLGLTYGSFLEWWIHKKLFHEHGRKKDSPFAYHLRDHHVVAKKNDFIDERLSSIETGGLFFLMVLHLPFLWINSLFFITAVIYAMAFFILHNLGHRNPAYAKRFQNWHYRHHMKNPNSNWNVVLPIADFIMRTNK